MAVDVLTNHGDFLRLLPWAKAMAKAQGHSGLTGTHFLQAAHHLVQAQQWQVSPALAARLQRIVPADGLPVLREGITEKMPLSAELKMAIASASGNDIELWLTSLLPFEPSVVTPTAECTVVDVATDAVLQSLLPWLQAAMQHHQEEKLSTKAMAHAVLGALDQAALDEHIDFKYLCLGHSDELAFWLDQTGAQWQALRPTVAWETLLAPSDAMETALAGLHPDEHAPTPVWRWLHAAVSEANQFSRSLQVAYHEAGHAMALHVLAPEMSLKKTTIEPEGESSGHVAPDMNLQFAGVYRNSYEYLKEQVVISLAGRAVEERRFGKDRTDSGAVSDIQQATQLAWLGITVFGLDEKFGPLSLGAAQTVTQRFSDNPAITNMSAGGWLQELAQQRLHVWLAWGMAQARLLVDAHSDSIDRLAHRLFQGKTLSNAEVRAVLGAEASPFKLGEI